MKNLISMDDYLKDILATDEKFRLAYDELEEEFNLWGQLLAARKNANMTQEQVAKAMGTNKTTVARLERFIENKPSPSFATLKRFAKAVNCRLEIKLVPCDSN